MVVVLWICDTPANWISCPTVCHHVTLAVLREEPSLVAFLRQGLCSPTSIVISPNLKCQCIRMLHTNFVPYRTLSLTLTFWPASSLACAPGRTGQVIAPQCLFTFIFMMVNCHALRLSLSTHSFHCTVCVKLELPSSADAQLRWSTNANVMNTCMRTVFLWTS